MTEVFSKPAISGSASPGSVSRRAASDRHTRPFGTEIEGGTVGPDERLLVVLRTVNSGAKIYRSAPVIIFGFTCGDPDVPIAIPPRAIGGKKENQAVSPEVLTEVEISTIDSGSQILWVPPWF